MRILDEVSDKKIDRLTLCLTREEASELIDTFEQLLKNPNGNHGHISDFDSNKEITVCVYDPNNLDLNFHKRVISLIREDK